MIPMQRASSPTIRPGYLRHALVLGLVTAIGPFAIDMYVPSLPSIGAALNASSDQVQLTLTAFFVALSAAQLIFGPFSDRVGRRLPIFLGLALFIAGSIGCSTATSIGALVAFRIVEGLGAAGGMTVCQAVVRDLHTGPSAARLLSLLMLVFSTSPIVAPLAGSFLVQFAGWRAVFWTVSGLAAMAMVAVALGLEETLPGARRHPLGLFAALVGYGKLLGDRRFLGLAFVGAFAISSFFVFLSSSPFVYMGRYGLTPRLYSLAFSINAVAFFGMAQANGWLTARLGLRRVAWRAAIGFAAAETMLLTLVLLGRDGLAIVAPCLFAGNAFLGLLLPTTTVIAMEDNGANAGSAAALIGTLQLLTGAAVIALAGLVTDGTPKPMAAAIAACALTTAGLAYLSLGRRGAATPSGGRAPLGA